MMLIILIIVYAAEWFFYPDADNQWGFLLGSKHLIIVLMAISLLQASQSKSLLIRSILALLVIDSFTDLIKYETWLLSDQTFDISLISPFLFIPWLFFTLFREYPDKIDNMNNQNVNILILKPDTQCGLFKSLFGYPASSICIASHGFIWSFRRHSGLFEKSKYSERRLNRHLVIDTKIKLTVEIVEELSKVLGSSNKPYIKCVWAIRNVLNMLGKQYAIKSWLDYVPGFYIMRILKR